MAARAIIEHEFQPDLTGPADPYRRLGVTRDATAADIKRAWRALAQVYHPDHGGDAEIFGQLKLCYETLIDPARRAEYDRSGTLKDATPDNSMADACGVMIVALERVIQCLIKASARPKNADMVDRIRSMLSDMDDELFKEQAQIDESLPEWEAVAKRFKVKKGQNVFAMHITAKLNEFRVRRGTIARQRKAIKLARKLMADYSFDWDRPETYEQNRAYMQSLFVQAFTAGT